MQQPKHSRTGQGSQIEVPAGRPSLADVLHMFPSSVEHLPNPAGPSLKQLHTAMYTHEKQLTRWITQVNRVCRHGTPVLFNRPILSTPNA